uniref:Uncharacterized protein n=1 Tax=viral metagenome TaxID=1070528 RepID=A0A6M3M0C4_9ZZZZ
MSEGELEKTDVEFDDPDDIEMEVTPEDVIKILGFDPAKEEE